jgi:hypothetical protein
MAMEAQEQVQSARRQRYVARILLVALALGGLLVSASGCAPRTTVESVVVNASVDSFGTLEATEERTLVVASGAPIEWDYTFRVGAVFEVLGVSGNGGAYVLAEDPAAEEAGTYTVSGDDDQMQIVAYPRPSDKAQTVTLTYRVQGVALRWNDTSEFSWRFLRDKEKSPVDSVRIHVSLPGEVSKDTVRAWANGPLYSEAAVNDDGSIDVSAPELPAKTELEAEL